MSFFKPEVSFPLNFASPFRDMTHNSSEIIWLKHYMLWTKRARQKTVFQTFECSNKIPHVIFADDHKVRVYLNFVSLFSVMKDNSSVFFQLKPYILLAKRSNQSEIFRDLRLARCKFTKFLVSYLKFTLSQVLFVESI